MNPPFTSQQLTILFAATMNAVVGGVLLYKFFNSRWWSEMVTGPDGRVKAGDQMKAGAFVLGCVMVAAIVIAELAYGREASAGLLTLNGALFAYSGVLQDNKRLEKKDQLAAAKPEAPVTVSSKQTDISANQVTVTE